MRRSTAAHRLVAGVGLVLGLALVFLPLACLYVSAAWGPAAPGAAGPDLALGRTTATSVLLAGAVAGLAVVLGWVPGRCLGTATRGVGLLFALTLAPLVLPRYVLYYAWTLLLAPTTVAGRWLAAQPMAVARGVGTATSAAVLVGWYWPLAALVLAQGWRGLDRDVLGAASLEAGRWRRAWCVLLPMLARPAALAFAVCFVLVLAEYATFHLAGVRTIGSVLGVLYEQTGSAEAVACAAVPLVALAVAVGVALGRQVESRADAPPVAGPDVRRGPGAWAVIGVLLGVSLLVPVGLLAASVEDWPALGRLWGLQRDGLAVSASAAALASVLALGMAGGVLAAGRLGAAGRAAATVMRAVLLAAMFVPGSLVGVAMLRTHAMLALPAWLADGWWVLAAGQAARFAGVALVLLRLAGDAADEPLAEMASADGAGPWQAWWHVHLPRHWPLVLGAAVLVFLFSLTEVAATMVLLAPGVPNFTQRLLNQMHYARDQHVVASCLAPVAAYGVLGVAAAGLVRLRAWRSAGSARGAAALLAAGLAALAAAGCSGPPQPFSAPEVVRLIGRSGRGPGEFLYPRALDFDAGGNLYVADRTGRIQQFSPEGEVLGLLRLPDTEAGYPTGLTVGPDGLLYIADTHYHRVLVYEPGGRLVRSFGEFGTGDGQFIYPTDVALAGDRVYVSEYGGNDRVSLYDAAGRFLRSFGRPGTGRGEFSRPSALAADVAGGVLYVADACNHRVARYTLEGELIGYFGSLGQAPGELRYPYGLARAPGGRLAVSEFGNNRVQVFGPQGRSEACLGGAGRGPGELACPWAVGVDGRGRLAVVDSGNNRVQVWRL